jgi:hypothetical protein
MGIRCIIKVEDVLKHGPLDITHLPYEEESWQYAKLDGWESPGDYFKTTIEFDFNSWGGTRTWLEPWLNKFKVPYRIV